MKIKKSELVQLQIFEEGIAKFLAIASVQDARGENNLAAIQAAKETLFDMKDWIAQNMDEED